MKNEKVDMGGDVDAQAFKAIAKIGVDEVVEERGDYCREEQCNAIGNLFSVILKKVDIEVYEHWKGKVEHFYDNVNQDQFRNLTSKCFEKR